MTTNLLDRVPVDRIRAEARRVQLGRAILTLVVGIFWALGWLAGKATLGIGFAYAAAKVGFAEARDPTEVARGRAP